MTLSDLKDYPWIPRVYLLQEWFDLERRGQS